MGVWLKQSTATIIMLGPFVDSGDGNTHEEALAINQADVRLSKAGSDTLAQKNEATAAVHVEHGWYHIHLDDTDTNTCGRLLVYVHVAGALAVWREYMVVEEQVYDSFASTDYLQVDALQLSGNTQSATDLKDFADAGYDPDTNKVQGVVLVDTTTTNTDMVAAAPTAADNADAVWDEVITAAAHAVDQSGAYYVRRLYQSIVTRLMQAQGGAAGTITLDLAASAVNDYYKGMVIAVFSGTGTGQARACYAYDGGTKVASIRPSWATNPAADSWFAILNVGSTVVAAIEDIDFGATMKASINSECDTAITDSTIHTDVGTAIADIAATHIHAAAADTQTVAATMANAVLAGVTEGAITLKKATNIMLAALAGKSTGGGTANIKFRDQADAKDRIAATVDADGNRTAITNDGA